MKGSQPEPSMEDLRGRRKAFLGILAVVFAVDLACVLTLVYFLMNGKDFSSLILLVVPIVGSAAAAAPLMIQLGIVNKQLAERSKQATVEDPRTNLER